MGKGQKPGKGGGSTGGGPSLGGDADDPTEFRAFSDGLTDVTYHTPAWHKARIETLMAPRVSYEDWKLKQKEAEGKLAAVAENEEKNMREYRAMLDADRAKRLAKGTNFSKDEHKKKKSKDKKKDKKSKRKKDKKEKDRKREKKSKHKKRRRSSSSSSSSEDDSSSSSSSSEDERSSKKRKSESGTYKRGKDEPVRLSEFLRS